MWLLEADGTLERGDAPDAEIAAEAGAPDPAALADAATIRFGGTQDGRGFSVARRLRAARYEGRLVAAGPLEPDQARHAFQCGFDAVAIEDATLERHSREAWADALRVSVTALYVSDPETRLDAPDLWARRHAA